MACCGTDWLQQPLAAGILASTLRQLREGKQDGCATARHLRHPAKEPRPSGCLPAYAPQVSELSATQHELEQHVEGMFAAPAWRASPRQCELSDRLKVGWGHGKWCVAGWSFMGPATWPNS